MRIAAMAAGAVGGYFGGRMAAAGHDVSFIARRAHLDAIRRNGLVIKSVHGVRYQVKDVARAIAFYTSYLGFSLERQLLPAFANVSLGDFQILLSGPGASGSRPLPNGETQEPGGWNRVVLKVADLPACITALKQAGIHFRNEMETGPGGRQIQIEDPDGNPLELFEPARER